MNYNEYTKKTCSILTILKFLFFSIAAGVVAMIFNFMTAAAFGFSATVFLLKSSVSLIFAMLSIVYLIALGVYIGVNSK